MREYGQIQCAFWQSDDAQQFSDVGKLLATYLMTGPHSNGIGCYRCPDGYIMEDLGWSAEKVSKGFAELFGKGFVYRFEGVVFIPNFLRWNNIANPNVAKARIAEFVALPKGEAKSRAALAVIEFCRFLDDDQIAYLETVTQTVTQTVCQTETNPNQTKPIQTLPGKAKEKAPSSGDLLSGVDPQVAKDFAAMRKAKGAPITETTMKGMRREADAAGLTLDQALTIALERGWRSFKAEWMKPTDRQWPAAVSGQPALLPRMEA